MHWAKFSSIPPPPSSPPLFPFFFWLGLSMPSSTNEDILDDLYNWEENVQQSLEAAAQDLAVDPMEEVRIFLR